MGIDLATGDESGQISLSNAGAAITSLAWIVAVFLVIAFASLSAWATFGSLMRRLIDTPAKLRAFNIAMALLLVASALPVAYDLWITS